jgi:polyhydroxybutyrate depolymerase
MPWANHRLLPLAAIVATACLPILPEVEDPCGDWPSPGLYRLPVDLDGMRTRAPLVYVPAGRGPRDLVVALHGGGGDGRAFGETARLFDLADQEGAVIVLPDGTGLFRPTWAAGGGCCGEAGARGLDDVAFLREVAAQVRPKVCGRALLAVGFSAGGMMAQRWACEDNQVDAALTAAGPLMIDGYAACPIDPKPVLLYHGTADTTVPFDGGFGNGGQVDFRSHEETVAYWRWRNLCEDGPGQTSVSGDTRCTTWTCDAPTVSCAIDGYGHAWPGGLNTNSDAQATLEGWSWFQGLEPQPSDEAPITTLP